MSLAPAGQVRARLVPALIALLASGILAACGSSSSPAIVASSPAASASVPSVSGAASVAPPGSSPAPKPSTIGVFRRAFTSPTAAFAPLWVAVESGAFALNGVDLQMINATTSAASAALIADQLDGLFNSSPTIISADAAGAGLIMVGSMLDHPLFSVYAAASITSPAQLKGRPFGCGKPGTPIEFGCLTALKQLGLSPNDVQLRRLDTDEQLYAALAANQVDATVIQPPEIFVAERNGFHKLAGIPETPFQNIGLTVKRERVERLRPVLLPMLRSLQSGIRRFDGDRAFSIQVLRKYTRNDDQDFLNRTYDFFKQVGFRTDMKVDREGLQEVISFLTPTNEKVATLKVDDLFDNSFAEKL